MLLPAEAPATSASGDCVANANAPPKTSAKIDWLFASFSRCCRRARCPPVICPISWASTPITWPGVLARIKSPLWIKIFWPPATKAFKL